MSIIVFSHLPKLSAEFSSPKKYFKDQKGTDWTFIFLKCQIHQIFNVT
ncbi:hypothetical protein ABVS_0936 [Acinetobacter lwoffii]|nr:hypothetical protein ABVS_0936 [Acinetobacter lwoffii]